MKQNESNEHSHDLSRRQLLEVSVGAAALGMLGRPQSAGAQ
jgi:hypothetical protein